MFRLNILLALAWMALIGHFSFEGFVEGFIVALLTLSVSEFAQGRSSYLRRAGTFLRFFFTFLWDVITSSLRIALIVVTPRLNIRPAVVAIPLDITRDSEITLLANMITLTPGTLSLDVSMDKKVLYVHTFDMADVETFRQGIKNRFEARVQEVMR